MGALKNIDSPDYAHGYFSRNLQWAFVPIDTKNVRTKFEVRTVALPVPEIIGGTEKNYGSPWIRPRSFFPKFLTEFCSDGPYEYTCQI